MDKYSLFEGGQKDVNMTFADNCHFLAFLEHFFHDYR